MSDEHVGSVGEEAAKLMDALQDWVKESGAAGAASGLGGLGGGLGEQWRTVNEHLATGGADCTYCPVCQVIHRMREASPEVRGHVAVAASSLLQAAAALIETRAPRPSAGQSDQSTTEPRVTKIDLDGEGAPGG